MSFNHFSGLARCLLVSNLVKTLRGHCYENICNKKRAYSLGEYRANYIFELRRSICK